MAETYDDFPTTGVWEITMGCNMRCRHCGSGCESPLPDELTTDEAMDLVAQLAELRMQWITLSGGEPLMRKDWHLIASELNKKGIIPNLITNGWYLTEGMVSKALESGIGVLAVSLDGLEENHDHMRQEGSFQRVVNGLRLMGDKGQKTGVITTVSRRNLEELPKIKELLLSLGVSSWQLQIGLPMGNYRHTPGEIMPPEAVDSIIDFCYASTLEGRIKVYPADCVGYYNLKELETRRMIYRTEGYPLWMGCNAGRRSLGILHNGEILGCTSIRDRSFLEGSIRQRPLKEIWNDPNAFRWSRQARKQELAGSCRICQYGDQCLGGCPNTRLTMHGSLQSENSYCSYHLRLSQTREKLAAMDDGQELLDSGISFTRQRDYQLAVLTLERALSLLPQEKEGWRHLGFAHFSINNMPECEEANRRALALDPADAYALKGLGLALHRQGHVQEGIDHLRQAVTLSPADDLDAVHDLVVVLTEEQRRQEALELLEQHPQLRLAMPHLQEQLAHPSAP